MVSYRSNDLTLAGEYGSIIDSTTGGASAIGGGGVVAAAHQKKATLLSVYGVYHFPNTRYSLIGRADVLNSNTADTTVQSKTTRLIAGVAYQLSPNLRLLADVDLLSFKSGYVVNAGNYAGYVNRNLAYVQAMYSY
jgi:hypothetical protein